MIDLGLTKAQDDAYRAALVTSHRIRTKVLVLDANEAPVKGLVPQVLSGAVTVEASAAVSRSLSMTLLDPNHKLTFDSASPADGALYADNFVQVTYGVETSLGWVDVPVFTGPVTGYSLLPPSKGFPCPRRPPWKTTASCRRSAAAARPSSPASSWPRSWSAWASR